jgi:hypothetical protein
MRNRLLAIAALCLVVLAAFFPPGASAQVCNPYTQGSWAVRAPVPTPIVRAWGAFFPGNGNFYALGGRQTDAAGSDYLNPREYNPSTNTWTVKAAAFPDNQVNNMVGGTLNFGGTNLITVVGGSAAGATTATAAVRTYDPVTDTLSPLAADNWPGNVAGTILPGGAAVFNNRLYVFGGFNINVGMINQIWEFNPAAAPGARWTQKVATLPAPRGYIPVAESGGFIYLMGGSDFVGGLVVDTNQSLRYDPTADAITTIATIPRDVGETRAVRQPLDGSIWVISGGRVPPNPTTDVNVYNIPTNTWSTAPAILTPRRNFPADVDPVDGRIWAAGGYDTGGVTPLDVNEQFTCVIPVDLMTFGVE